MLDANQQQPHLLADARHWSLSGVPAVAYDARSRVLRLASTRTRSYVEDEALARDRLELVPQATDRFGTRARWDVATRRVLASGAAHDGSEIAIYAAAPGWPVTDLAVGQDDVLYMIVDGRLVLQDLRARWELVDRLATDGFTGVRLAPAPGGGVFVLDRAFRHIARVHGLPMRTYRGSFGPNVFRPDPEDGDLPRGRVLRRAIIPAAETAIAIASSPSGRLALLTWVAGADARLRVLREDETFGPAQILEGVRFPYSLAWLSEERVAVLIAQHDAPLAEALAFPVLDTSDGEGAEPARRSLALGDLHPLRDHDGGPFVHAPENAAYYPSARGPLPLLPLAWPSFAPAAEVQSAAALDSGAAQTVWHRLYLDAAIPPGCGVRVWLATTDHAELPEEPSAVQWHEHHFGAVPESTTAEVPRGAWLRERSELPLHPGFLPCATRKDEAGLFSVLIQRAGLRVRTLVGRYLWVRLELRGDGRASPEVAALRAYAARRSYSEHLPAMYRESLFGPEADERGASTRADFLDRFLGLFESVLTPLEDRIARADLLTDPRTTPADALEWLASWVGFGFLPGITEARRRTMLERAPELYRQRGTLAGLELALDLASGGGVSSGEIAVVEDFRLRRTFVTILGADFANESDPLLPGLAISGNSRVGDTLILGDEQRVEFLALFAPGIERTARERNAVALLFERLAFRATVIVHQEVEPQDLGIIRAVVAREAPAHVEVKVVTATERFLVGVSSLLGVDTYLARRGARQPVRVDVSDIGVRDVVEHVPSLDPRLDRPDFQEPP